MSKNTKPIFPSVILMNKKRDKEKLTLSCRWVYIKLQRVTLVDRSQIQGQLMVKIVVILFSLWFKKVNTIGYFTYMILSWEILHKKEKESPSIKLKCKQEQ